MAEADYSAARRDSLVKPAGFQADDDNEQAARHLPKATHACRSRNKKISTGRRVRPSALEAAKRGVYQAMTEQGIKKSELARRLGWHMPQIDRLPSASAQEPLLVKAHDLAISAPVLAGQPIARDLRGLLRAMNLHYTKLIEGQHTRPYELEQALRQDFSVDANLAARQRLTKPRRRHDRLRPSRSSRLPAN